jgi:hypothetical protein
MKKVFRSSGELCHIWAHQTQAEGRAGNVFFRDSMYFSYGTHYCIGRIFGTDHVALNIENNSSTTNRHRSEAWQATRHMGQIFVYGPDGLPEKGRTERAIQHLMEKAAAAKPNGKRPSHLAEALRVAEHYNIFCDWTERPGLKIELPAYDEAEMARMRKVQREYAAAERERAKARAAHLALSLAEKIAAWRAGSGYSLPYGVGTMLRLGYRGRSVFEAGYQMVETSHGAYIPVEDARRLWPLIQRAMKGDRDYEVGMPLGDYQLTKIRRDGSIMVGCHDIPYVEIEGIAAQLGLISSTVVEPA